MKNSLMIETKQDKKNNQLSMIWKELMKLHLIFQTTEFYRFYIVFFLMK